MQIFSKTLENATKTPPLEQTCAPKHTQSKNKNQKASCNIAYYLSKVLLVMFLDGPYTRSRCSQFSVTIILLLFFQILVAAVSEPLIILPIIFLKYYWLCFWIDPIPPFTEFTHKWQTVTNPH
jgi:hypothetical protein